MKLFQVHYLDSNDGGSYLAVGTDEDTCETIEKRESKKRNNLELLYFLRAREIKEVDGHEIMVK